MNPTLRSEGPYLRSESGAAGSKDWVPIATGLGRTW